MRIINTFDSISKCYVNGNFDINAWRKYTSIFSLELSDKCEQDSQSYNFAKDILPVLNNAFTFHEKMESANNSFLSISKKLKRNIDKISHTDLELDIILYLGLCNGAGWATTLDGKNAILLGIEKIIELNWQGETEMQALIFHEVGHIWHKTHGNLYFDISTETEKSILQLYQEGVAMKCEHLLCGDDNYYHQNKDNWLDWCVENESQIKNEYLKRMNNNASTQDFYGDWCNYCGYSDVGYFLGCKFIEYLEKEYTLIEIANLNFEVLFSKFKSYAKSNKPIINERVPSE